MVELKNGETYNGHLVNCDTWMNVHLKEVICTSKVAPCSDKDKIEEHRQDGDRFWRVAEIYIRGNTIKYIRVPDEVFLPLIHLLSFECQIIELVQDDVYVKKPEGIELSISGILIVWCTEQAPQPTTRAPASARGGRRGRGPSDRSRGRWPAGRGRGKILSFNTR